MLFDSSDIFDRPAAPERMQATATVPRIGWPVPLHPVPPGLKRCVFDVPNESGRPSSWRSSTE